MSTAVQPTRRDMSGNGLSELNDGVIAGEDYPVAGCHGEVVRFPTNLAAWPSWIRCFLFRQLLRPSNAPSKSRIPWLRYPMGLRSASAQVFGRRHEETSLASVATIAATSLALRRPASKKRQGTKSRESLAPAVPRALWGFDFRAGGDGGRDAGTRRPAWVCTREPGEAVLCSASGPIPKLLVAPDVSGHWGSAQIIIRTCSTFACTSCN
jgi:hypothetical protein